MGRPDTRHGIGQPQGTRAEYAWGLTRELLCRAWWKRLRGGWRLKSIADWTATHQEF